MRSKLIYILCLTALAYGSSSAQWIKSDVRRAGKLYKKGNYAAASAEYRRAMLKQTSAWLTPPIRRGTTIRPRAIWSVLRGMSSFLSVSRPTSYTISAM